MATATSGCSSSTRTRRSPSSSTSAAAATVAHWLIDEIGIAPGDRVAIAMRNYPEWPMAFWGAVAAGAVVVPLNAWWTGAELEYGLADSGSRVVFCDAERALVLADHFANLPLDAVVVARPDTDLAAGHLDFGDVVGDAPATALPAVAETLEPDDDATIFYTSGTTGSPKGALGTHRNMLHQPGEPPVRQRPRTAIRRRLEEANEHSRQAQAVTPERLPAVGPVLPRHRLPLGAPVEHRGAAGSS